jgi:hypothetical protein
VSRPTTGFSFLCRSVVLQRFQFLQICGAPSAVATALRAVRTSMIVILYGGQRAGCCRFTLGRRSRSDRPTSSSTIQRFNDLTIDFPAHFLSLSKRYATIG